MTVKIYAERDAMELDKAGNHYSRHISAMTSEGLHSKSDIAAELGWRDAKIAGLQRKVEALAVENVHLKQSNSVALAILNDEETMITSLWASSVQLVSSETPVTDAVLAEIRAQARAEGVDMAIEHLTKKFQGSGGVGVPVMALEHLASGLRKESGQ